MSTTYTEDEAVEALSREGITGAEGYLEQVVEAGPEISDQPEDGYIFTEGDLDVVRDQFGVDLDLARESAAEWGLVEVSEDNPGYGDEDVDRLAVERSAEFIDFVPSIEEADALVSRQVGFPVEAKAIAPYFAGRAWEFRIRR